MRESRLIHPDCLQCRHLDGRSLHCGQRRMEGRRLRLERPSGLSRQTQKYRDPSKGGLLTPTTFTGRCRGVHCSTPLGFVDFLWMEMTKKGEEGRSQSSISNIRAAGRGQRLCGKKRHVNFVQINIVVKQCLVPQSGKKCHTSSRMVGKQNKGPFTNDVSREGEGNF